MRRIRVLGCCLVGSLVAAQESGAELAARVRGGGWLEVSKYRRSDAGVIESWSTAQTGDPERGEFLPLIDYGRQLHYENLGLIGLLSLFCHGDGDLLAMTDADFHFHALGMDGSDVALRQYLVLPPPSFDGPRGRAERLDRLLVVDRLVARRCRGAVAELAILAERETLPAVLRERCRHGVATLTGKTEAGLVRRCLDPEVVMLPAAFDAALVIDHSRLPDLRWLTALGRRLGVLVTARAIELAGGTISSPQCNGGQRMADVVSAAPFWLVHRFGNARLDHSVVTIGAKADERMPVALTWNAVGEFEPDGWREAKPSAAAIANNPLLGGTLSVEATTLYASTDRSRGARRPSTAAKLLLDDGVALRAVVPSNSKLWPALAFLNLPAAGGGELRVMFGDPTSIVLVVEARDEDAAEAWVAQGKQLLTEAKAAVDHWPDELREQPGLKVLLQSLWAASFSTKDKAAFATVEVRGFDRTKMLPLAEAVLPAIF